MVQEKHAPGNVRPVLAISGKRAGSFNLPEGKKMKCPLTAGIPTRFSSISAYRRACSAKSAQKMKMGGKLKVKGHGMKNHFCMTCENSKRKAPVLMHGATLISEEIAQG